MWDLGVGIVCASTQLVPVLLFALDGSVHSDPSLLLIAAIIWSLGLAAVVETSREPPG